MGRVKVGMTCNVIFGFVGFFFTSVLFSPFFALDPYFQNECCFVQMLLLILDTPLVASQLGAWLGW